MIRYTKDLRTIYSGPHYKKFRRAIWERCGGFCEMCGQAMVEDWEDLARGFHVHHVNGRGGGKRDDVESKVRGVCAPCHRGEHGQ